MIQKFLDYIALERRYSPRTVDEYSDDLRFFCHYLGVSVENFDANRIDEDDVKVWMVNMLDGGQSPRSVKRRLSALRSLYKYLLREGLVKRDITRAILAPKAPKLLPISFRESEMEEEKRLAEVRFNPDEPDIIKRFEQVRDCLVVEMLYQTGMRRAELAGLTEDSVCTQEGWVRVFGKRSKERVIPMGDGLIQLIEQYRQLKTEVMGESTCDSFLVRHSCAGHWAPIKDYNIYGIVRARMGEVSTLAKHSPHVLRHTFATTMLNHGADIRSIQALLGHASLATTQIYAHASFEQIQRVYGAAHPRSKSK